jgi:hypothetical protein
VVQVHHREEEAGRRPWVEEAEVVVRPQLEEVVEVVAVVQLQLEEVVEEAVGAQRERRFPASEVAAEERMELPRPHRSHASAAEETQRGYQQREAAPGSLEQSPCQPLTEVGAVPWCRTTWTQAAPRCRRQAGHRRPSLPSPSPCPNPSRPSRPGVETLVQWEHGEAQGQLLPWAPGSCDGRGW